MIIEYIKKSVYGKETLYIKDLPLSKVISGLTGKKTIDNQDIVNLSKLGVSFIQVIN